MNHKANTKPQRINDKQLNSIFSMRMFRAPNEP